MLVTPHGATARLFGALKARAFALVTSEVQLDELRGALMYPRLQRRTEWTQADVNQAVDAVRDIATVVPGDYEVVMVPHDPKDNPIVACALEAGADYLVTDDRKDLLPLKVVRVAGYAPVQVVSPPSFLRLLQRGNQSVSPLQ